jgi:hypothetical protein
MMTRAIQRVLSGTGLAVSIHYEGVIV